MSAILALVYGFYFVLVGIRGNAPSLFAMIGQEKQFLYWIVVLLVVAALWESETGEKLAKPLVVLIVIGFLLSHNNWQTIGTNFRAILPAAKG